MLPLLAVALSLLVGPAIGQAQPPGAPCRYRVRIMGYADATAAYIARPDDSVIDNTESHASFILDSRGAVIVGPTLEVGAELGGHLRSYVGRHKVTNLGHIEGCNVRTTSNERAEPPLGAMLYIEGPQENPSVRLSVTYDLPPLLNFFHNVHTRIPRALLRHDAAVAPEEHGRTR